MGFVTRKLFAAAGRQTTQTFKQIRRVSDYSQRRYYDTLKIKPEEKTTICSIVPGSQQQSCKIIFDDNKAADFKYVWLRDNCKCNQCVDPSTKQKLLDTPSIDINIRPMKLNIDASGQLVVDWIEKGKTHQSIYDADWLTRYGQCFIQENFSAATEEEFCLRRPPITLWDRTTIWKNFPQLSYAEFMESERGLLLWLEMFHRYGVALLRGVPATRGKIIDVVKRFAYVKETSYGVTFDVVAEPDPEHLAFTGAHLHHHTDMNYREKSPGMQFLHCLKSTDLGNDPLKDVGGLSFFVDGFRAAKWLKDNEAAAFHILAATPVKFEININGRKFSQTWPIICTNNDSEVTEIHYNNRTMGPLQVPSHLITPFYHAYHLLTEKIRADSMQLSFHLTAGDLVAFNNRRVLHGRTSFDQTRVSRHLEGCYVDIDEAVSIYDSLRTKTLRE